MINEFKLKELRYNARKMDPKPRPDASQTKSRQPSKLKPTPSHKSSQSPYHQRFCLSQYSKQKGKITIKTASEKLRPDLKHPNSPDVLAKNKSRGTLSHNRSGLSKQDCASVIQSKRDFMFKTLGDI